MVIQLIDRDVNCVVGMGHRTRERHVAEDQSPHWLGHIPASS